ncbi:MAG: sigma-70 family RNA polymerase sigma factor [Myxococcales bacterium]|nr:sigma-70 family RNA polymerase sigma factor [Myxococcales bacterium]MCB9690949.1 sigma-70 family RNA polymerase sigma factor [Alphaproteobacteria bacterium]
MDTECDVDVLAGLMLAGDARALERCARCYGERLVAVARSSCRLADDAEDAVQDALLEAARSMDGYRGEGSPLAWLSSLVVHRCHRLGRGRRHDPALHVRDVEVACGCASPEGQAFHSALGRRIGEALVALDPCDRAVVVLAHEGFTGPEIAERLDLTPDAVRSRLKRARQRLRDDLEPWRTP